MTAGDLATCLIVGGPRSASAEACSLKIDRRYSSELEIKALFV
jgi:hypothetical protein